MPRGAGDNGVVCPAWRFLYLDGIRRGLLRLARQEGGPVGSDARERQPRILAGPSLIPAGAGNPDRHSMRVRLPGTAMLEVEDWAIRSGQRGLHIGRRRLEVGGSRPA